MNCDLGCVSRLYLGVELLNEIYTFIEVLQQYRNNLKSTIALTCTEKICHLVGILYT